MRLISLHLLALGTALALGSPLAQAFDADEAQALAKKSGCTKCHAADKDKKGPSMAKISAKYKGKADAEEKVILNMTTTPKVKFEDGTEEEHKAVKSDDKAAIKNLAQWILSH